MGKLTLDERACKGCGKEIVSGQLRRGDNWHAKCFPFRESESRPRTPKVRRIVGLTETQVIILTAAAASPSGSVGFYAGDRKGTRVVKVDGLGRPWIVAYSYPAHFMKARGLLSAANEPHTYFITPAGRAALQQREK